MTKCTNCGQNYYGATCNCKKHNLKCFGCGGEYKGEDCNCGNGVDINKHRRIMLYQWNKDTDIKPENIAKGLIYFKKHHPKMYERAIKNISPELLQAARETYNPTTAVSINEKGEIEK